MEFMLVCHQTIADALANGIAAEGENGAHEAASEVAHEVARRAAAFF